VSNTPSYPKKLPIVLIATLATFVLSTGFVTTGELLKLTGPLQAPVPVPERDVTDRTPVVRVRESRPDRGTASGLELERLAAQFVAAGERARKITVIGAETPAGTSLTALRLARLMSRNANVVLVDLSLESSAALSAAVADPHAPGLSDLASGAASFGQIISRDKMSRVQIVGAGQRPETSILRSPRLAMAIDALTQVYDHVILDAGAIDNLPEELAASNAQAVLVTRSMFDNVTRSAIETELIKAGFHDVAVLDTANDNLRADDRVDPSQAALLISFAEPRLSKA